MKKLGLKLLGILIVGIVILQSTVVIAASQSDINANNKKINEAKEDLNEVQTQKSETVKQVEELTNKITDYQTQIEELNNQIADLNNKIAESEQKIKETQEEYNKNKKLFDERLVATYEAGDTSYLDVILSSESFTDAISNVYLVTEIANYDTEVMEKIQKQQKEIEEAKKTLEESKKELDTSKASKQSVSTQLKTAKTEKDQQVAKLSDDEKKIQEQIEELKVANVQIAKEIKAAQERYAKEIAALNNNKNNGTNNSSGGNNANTGSGVLQRPVTSGSISAGMYYPSSGRYHGAIDYAVPIGTPIYASATGVVIKTANLTSSYGTYVVIQHAGGLQTWYAHGTSGSICVSPGQTVSRGQLIMKSGNSGNSGGPHLHFEVRVAPYDYNTCRVNPANYF